MVAALRMRIREGKFREPLGCAPSEPLLDSADLVVKVVSLDNPRRGPVEKRIDYAKAGIAEYWIVDGRQETITVLALRDGAYAEHGVSERGEIATSALLDGFEANVSMVFDAAGGSVDPQGRP